MGCEHDANVVVDATGLPYMGAGMSACARDLARFGELLRNDGFYNDMQIVPASWVRDTRLGNDQVRQLFATSEYRSLLPNGHYRNQVWADPTAQEIMCIGIHGRLFMLTAPRWFASNSPLTRTADLPYTAPPIERFALAAER